MVDKRPGLHRRITMTWWGYFANAKANILFKAILPLIQ